MNQLINTLNDNNISYVLNEPMSAHTTFKIGGAADILITVNHIDELQTALGACKASDIPVMILGNGSNLLVSDNGIEGAVITLDGDFKEITVDGDIITSGAGAKLSRLCSVALENSLTGLEFAYGIPGSVGGAMYMNAGAYGGEMKDVALSVTALTPDGEIREVPAEELALGYRTSIFKTNGDIILFAKYKLAQGDPAAIKEKMDDVMGLVKLVQDTVKAETGYCLEREIIRTGRE